MCKLRQDKIFLADKHQSFSKLYEAVLTILYMIIMRPIYCALTTNQLFTCLTKI